MPSNSPHPFPPRLRFQNLRAVGPGVLLGLGFMAILPLAQVIDAHPVPTPPVVETIVQPIPTPIEPPEQLEPDDPPDEPIKDVDPPNLLPDPFVIDVPAGGDFIRFANPSIGSYDFNELTDEIAQWADLTVTPRPLVQGEPVYPPSLRGPKIEGDVRVKFLIRANGTVGRISIVSSTHPEFAAAAERAVRNWRFQPGERHGKPVAVWALQSIPFRIH